MYLDFGYVDVDVSFYMSVYNLNLEVCCIFENFVEFCKLLMEF